MSHITTQQNMVAGPIPFKPPTFTPPAASFLLQEDGTSKFILEDTSGFILLE